MCCILTAKQYIYELAKIKLMFREAIITRAATRRLSTASFDGGILNPYPPANGL
jgi:hypothetical protein